MADGSDSPVKGRKSRKVEHSRVAPPLPPSFVLLKGIASLTGVKSTFPTGLPGFAIDKYFVVVFLSSFNPHFSRPVYFPFVPRSFPSFFPLPHPHPCRFLLGISLEVLLSATFCFHLDELSLSLPLSLSLSLFLSSVGPLAFRQQSFLLLASQECPRGGKEQPNTIDRFVHRRLSTTKQRFPFYPSRLSTVSLAIREFLRAACLERIDDGYYIPDSAKGLTDDKAEDSIGK